MFHFMLISYKCIKDSQRSLTVHSLLCTSSDRNYKSKKNQVIRLYTGVKSSFLNIKIALAKTYKR